jgi:hypothetical protein
MWCIFSFDSLVFFSPFFFLVSFFSHRYALDVKEPKLEKKKFWDTMKKQEEGKVEGEEKGNEHVEEAILLQRQTLRDGKTSKIHRSRNSRSLVNDIVKGKKCKKDSDCDKAECRGSGMFSSGNCGPVAGTLPGKADCEKDVDCESGVCEGNLNGLTTGFCRREHQKFNAPCRRNEECESLMCTGGRFKGEGTCSLPLGTNQEKQQCNFDKECESNFCRGNMHGFTHGFCLSKCIFSFTSALFYIFLILFFFSCCLTHFEQRGNKKVEENATHTESALVSLDVPKLTMLERKHLQK